MEGNNDLDLKPGGEADPAAGGGGGADGPQDDAPETVSREEHDAQMAALNRQVAALNDQNSLYRAQIHLVQQGGSGAKPGPPEGDFFHGRDDEDVITVAELRAFQAQMSQQFGGAMGEMQLASKNNDYQEVVTTHLPNYLRDNPDDIALLRALPPALRPRLAYKLGVQDPSYQAKKNKESLEGAPNADVLAIDRNKRKPALGGKGGGSPLSQASQFESMSDADLEKHISKVKMGAARG